MKNIPLIILAAVALPLAFLTACKKKHDSVPPTPVEQSYLLQVIYRNGWPTDSFVYNDNNTVAHMYTLYFASSNFYGLDQEFQYIGQNIKMITYEIDDFYSSDSFVIKDNKLIRYFYEPNFYPRPTIRDTTIYTIRPDLKPLLIGSKDTMSSRIYAQEVSYREYTYNNDNLISNHYHSYTYQNRPVGSLFKDSSNSFLTYNHDETINPFHYFFSKNPIIIYTLDTYLPAGSNNLIKYTEDYSKIVPIQVFTYNYTYEDSGLIVKRQTYKNNVFFEENEYKFIKAK